MKNAKTDKKCQKASGVKHSDEMAAASLKARCKCTMMRKLFAAFDEERGLKTAKCMSNCQRGGKANKMSWPAKRKAPFSFMPTQFVSSVVLLMAKKRLLPRLMKTRTLVPNA